MSEGENKKRKGRPKKSDGEKIRFKAIQFYFTKEEFEKFISLVEKTDLTYSDFIKMKIFASVNRKSVSKKEKFREVDYKNLIAELNKIGGNINQIARRVNVNNSAILDSNIQASLEEVKTLIKNFKEEL